MTCAQCLLAYPGPGACPKCGHLPERKQRSNPVEVAGDLTLLTPAAIAELQSQIIDVHQTDKAYEEELRAKNCPDVAVSRNVRRRREQIQAQSQLRYVIAKWSGRLKAQGMTNYLDRQKQFYREFGIDILTAQGLKTQKANALAQRVLEKDSTHA